nr:helix-turn-helix transcriptional regulator [Streptomyces scabichelini]
MAQQVPDDDLRGQLLDAAGRLAGPSAAHSAPGPRLSPRELDVLTQVALGCNNAEAGRRLSLLPETVRSYLRSAMRKLGAGTRFEAVVAARRQGLLP